MTTVASCTCSVNDLHYALLRHPLRSPRPHVAVMSECCARVTSRFSLLAPYPTERIYVILHQKGNHVVHQIYVVDETEVFLDGKGGGG
jgi:hypothetical protein